VKNTKKNGKIIIKKAKNQNFHTHTGQNTVAMETTNRLV